MLPKAVLHIKEEIKELLDKPLFDNILSKKIQDEIYDYCLTETKDVSNFFQKADHSCFVWARGTMQRVYNMAAEDNYIFNLALAVKETHIHPGGFIFALKTLERAEEEGLQFPVKDPLGKWVNSYDQLLTKTSDPDK